MDAPSVSVDLAPKGTLERLDRFVRLTDLAMPIPGTRRTIGVDAALSLVPGQRPEHEALAPTPGGYRQMKTLIWCGTVTLAAIWSLIAWMLHGLVGMAGGVIESTTGMVPVDPVLSEWAAWLAAAGTGIGEWLVVVVWAIGALALMVLGFVATRFAKA